ncbi:hypothetical protein SAY86_000048 [Trapa natans]|uniref:PRONE domain-containing protein n=1 Tax=Trapa natans TaxID=22666 RepID=A0AAN7RGA2_TRANT|nr:hypothetical protein SAY86_000048 [Trapa natans]
MEDSSERPKDVKGGAFEDCGTGRVNSGQMETFADLIKAESSSSSGFSAAATAVNDEPSRRISEVSSSSTNSMSWPLQLERMPILEPPDCSSENGAEEDDSKDKQRSTVSVSEVEMMKERFAKLLLGEDMSGSGNGVSTALAISNAITNLCATLFGQLSRLEPLPPEKKSMWRREMNWLLAVGDHMVELVPNLQTFPDGSKLEVMTCRPRQDLYVNLQALRKLDNMLLEILDSFEDREFWYVDQGVVGLDSDGSASFQRALQRQEEKWWLPMPQVPPGGLHENYRKHLQYRRDSTNQILKAAMAINSVTLADMEIPQSYLEALPKSGRACLGDNIHRHIVSDHFTPESLLNCLDLSSEHQAIEIANRIEASIYVWRKRTNSKPTSISGRPGSKSSWELVRELMADGEKRELLAERAEGILLYLKQWFPSLPQTTLDMSKIQYNKDVGKSILESYSRVLESLAFNIVARIDDLLYVDDMAKHSDDNRSIARVGLIAHKSITIPYSVHTSGTPYRTTFKTPSFSPAHLQHSPTANKVGDKSPFGPSINRLPHRGFDVRKVFTDIIRTDIRSKEGRKSAQLHSALLLG